MIKSCSQIDNNQFISERRYTQYYTRGNRFDSVGNHNQNPSSEGRMPMDRGIEDHGSNNVWIYYNKYS